VTEPLPEGAPAPQAAPSEPKRTERPHPLTPLIRGWVVSLALLIGLGREVLNWFTERRPLPPLHLLASGIGGIAVAAMLVGLASWWATRFVIDADELRIESGILLRKSQRIAFDKVTSIDVLQPMAARIFALAELEIDIGSSERVKLRYLTRARAYALRDFLLSRAHSHRAELVETEDPGLRLGDLSAEDQVLVQTTSQRLLLGAVTSNEFISLLITIIITITAAVIAAPSFGGPVLVLALGVSAISGIGGFVVRRFTGQFNFTLSSRPAGLRISRGLASLTSQSLPPRRIQLVRLSQSLLWRRLGWYRAEIDILGLGMRNEEDTHASVSSVLLPVADRAQVRLVLAGIWPEADWESIELHPAPVRARWLHPVSGPFLGLGHDDLLVVSRHGWLERRWDLIPHARVQSVQIKQGPVSRWLKLTDLAFHTAGSRLNPHAYGLDAGHVLQRQDELIALAQAHRPDLTLAPGPAAESVLPVIQEAPPARRADQAEETISDTE
jgi:putative membrane protein